MQITLTDEDANRLREFLRDHFRDLEREIARTDDRAFRHALVERLEAIQRIVEQLEHVHA